MRFRKPILNRTALRFIVGFIAILALSFVVMIVVGVVAGGEEASRASKCLDGGC